MFLSELHPAGKGRTEMSVSVAWATVKRDGYEKAKKSRPEIPPVCLRLCPQLYSNSPLLDSSNYHTHFEFLLIPFLIFLIKQCFGLPDARESLFQHLRTACYGFSIRYDNMGTTQHYSILYMPFGH